MPFEHPNESITLVDTYVALFYSKSNSYYLEQNQLFIYIPYTYIRTTTEHVYVTLLSIEK